MTPSLTQVHALFARYAIKGTSEIETSKWPPSFTEPPPPLVSSSVLAWPLNDSVDSSTCLLRVDFRGPGRSGPCDAYRKAGGFRQLHRRVHGAAEGSQRRQRPLRRGEAIDWPGFQWYCRLLSVQDVNSRTRSTSTTDILARTTSIRGADFVPRRAAIIIVRQVLQYTEYRRVGVRNRKSCCPGIALGSMRASLLCARSSFCCCSVCGRGSRCFNPICCTRNVPRLRVLIDRCESTSLKVDLFNKVLVYAKDGRYPLRIVVRDSLHCGSIGEKIQRKPRLFFGPPPTTFSPFFFQVFGERGVHSRSAVGTNALPRNVPVEIEAIVEFDVRG